jgi:hypothetical protein
MKTLTTRVSANDWVFANDNKRVNKLTFWGQNLIRRMFIFIICFFTFSTLLKSQEIDLKKGLIAHYPFDGTAIDSVQKGNGEVNGAELTNDRFGNGECAYGFNGGSDKIIIPSSDGFFNLNNTGFSVSFWVFINSNQEHDYPRLLAYTNSSQSCGWEINYQVKEEYIASYLHTTNSQSEYTNYVGVELDKWIHFVMVYQDDSILTYRNGGLISRKYYPGYIPCLDEDLLVCSRYFVGKIDDLRFYNRTLAEKEVAMLSQNLSAIDAADKETVFYADFEMGTLDPVQMGYSLDLGAGGERGDISVVSNPDHSGFNTSEYVMMVSTPRSAKGQAARAEYKIRDQLPTKNRTHIYQWMVYFPDNYLYDVDTIWKDWSLISQFRTEPCSRYSLGGEEYEFFAENICYTGGIFNEIRINHNDYNKYDFVYRAKPDCNMIEYEYPRQEWIKFTYEILWTDEFDGYYRIWANEKLVGDSDIGIRTLPEGWIEGVCDIDWKVGLYDSWYDSENELLYYYIDNMEIYIDKTIEQACPECATTIDTVNNTSVPDIVVFGHQSVNDILPVEIYPSPMQSTLNVKVDVESSFKIYNVNGSVVYSTLLARGQNALDLRLEPGVFFVKMIELGANRTYSQKLFVY